jgi:hypothetical protein
MPDGLYLIPPANQFVGRDREIARTTGTRPERGELCGKPGRDDLKEMLGVLQIFEVVPTQIAETHTFTKALLDKLGRGVRDENLAPMAGRADPRGPVDV